MNLYLTTNYPLYETHESCTQNARAQEATQPQTKPCQSRLAKAPPQFSRPSVKPHQNQALHVPSDKEKEAR